MQLNLLVSRNYFKYYSLTTYHVLMGKQAAIWGYISRAGAFLGRRNLETARVKDASFNLPTD